MSNVIRCAGAERGNRLRIDRQGRIVMAHRLLQLATSERELAKLPLAPSHRFAIARRSRERLGRLESPPCSCSLAAKIRDASEPRLARGSDPTERDRLAERCLRLLVPTEIE